jgi:nucleoside-diphosphate-sugar epimerase
LSGRKVLIAGASGLVGLAAINHFRSRGIPVVTLSRRTPAVAADHVLQADLRDPAQVAAALSGSSDITELVYAAVYEKDDLVAGWDDPDQIATNDRMLRTVLETLLAHSPGLRHVSLMQGSKAYGSHVRPLKVPAREGKSELRERPNFYWLQEDYLRARQRGQGWHYTVFRPVPILGDSAASALNLIAALGIYAAFLRHRGEPLHFPGGGPQVAQAVDVEIVARAFDWASQSPHARNETFNLSNGDVYVWENIWDTIAETVGMAPGGKVPMKLSALAGCSAEWDAIRAAWNLESPSLAEFGGSSLQFADYVFRVGKPEPGPASFVSNVKVIQAGFCEVRDTEATFVRYLRSMQERRLIPAP